MTDHDPATAGAATTRAELSVEQLSVRFGGVQALHEVSLSIGTGEVVGLIGPNGAGKTTLFNALSGFVRAQSGRVRLGGRDLTGVPPWRRASLGLVRTFQQGGLVPDATALANLVMAQHARMRTGVTGGILGRSAAEERELVDRAADVLGRLGLSAFAQRPVRLLSHGLQKQVEVACAVVRRPRLLLLDEPSAGLDRLETGELATRVGELQAEIGCTTLVIDHDLRMVRHVARRIIVLAFGQVIADGDWDAVRVDPAVVAAYLGPQGEVTERKEGSARADARAG